MTPGPLTYWRTFRYLEPVQVYGRLWFRVSRPRLDRTGAVPARRAASGEWVAPDSREPRFVGPTLFAWAGESVDVSLRGWDDPSVEKLVRYNLHYFDDLNAIGAEARAEWNRALLLRWVAENPPATGTGWEPYPTSLRIVNWIKWALGGNVLPDACIESLVLQARWLALRIERHLRGNHVVANAKALVFAGLFFDGPEAAKWLAAGVGILERELDEQILPDGGQFERSPMYHDLAVEDLLDLCNVMQAYERGLSPRARALATLLRARLPGMRRWSMAMRHPDGGISFFNDAAFGVALDPSALDAYAARLAVPVGGQSHASVTHLADSGYVRVELGQMVALLDVAPVGPDYLPAHAHADTLSFELSLGGHRVFVNSGTSCYGSSPERQRQRGTAAHNTVVVNDADSSEVWSGFRVARRARPVGLDVRDGSRIVVRCAHDGYRRLRGNPLHVRTWEFETQCLVVEDVVQGSFSRAAARWHLHPALTVAVHDATTAAIGLPTGVTVRMTSEGAPLRLEASTWHPEFGASIPSTCIVSDFRSGTVRTRLSW